DVDVLNFGMTGYGPDQEERVIRAFAPLAHPDLVLLGLFINDYGDVLMSDDQFLNTGGFSRPAPDDLGAVLRLSNLVAWIRTVADEPLRSAFHRPGVGFELANAGYLKRGPTPPWTQGAPRVAALVRKMRDDARRNGSGFAIAYFPASIEVCNGASLPYLPGWLNLNDSSRWDFARPQRVTATIAAQLGVPEFDLRPALRAASSCPFQPHNMHLTAAGQRIAGDAIGAWVAPMLTAVGPTRRHSAMAP
ncbi:MAG: hypothetical protein ACREM8_12140, partial [Vulcanimicrobiaceae bacterium]